MLRSSPAGYLLGLEKELTPDGVIERLRRTVRRAGDAASQDRHPAPWHTRAGLPEVRFLRGSCS
jgi:hypothetical protein